MAGVLECTGRRKWVKNQDPLLSASSMQKLWLDASCSCQQDSLAMTDCPPQTVSQDKPALSSVALSGICSQQQNSLILWGALQGGSLPILPCLDSNSVFLAPHLQWRLFVHMLWVNTQFYQVHAAEDTPVGQKWYWLEFLKLEPKIQVWLIRKNKALIYHSRPALGMEHPSHNICDSIATEKAEEKPEGLSDSNLPIIDSLFSPMVTHCFNKISWIFLRWHTK